MSNLGRRVHPSAKVPACSNWGNSGRWLGLCYDVNPFLAVGLAVLVNTGKEADRRKEHLLGLLAGNEGDRHTISLVSSILVENANRTDMVACIQPRADLCGPEPFKTHRDAA